MTAVAVAGLGATGSRIAGRLVAAGHEVTVWNRPARKAELAELGAITAATSAEAASGSDVLIPPRHAITPVTALAVDLAVPGWRVTAMTKNANPRVWLLSYGTLQDPQVQITTSGGGSSAARTLSRGMRCR